MNRDLQSRSAIVIKGGLFLFIGLFASALLLIEHWSWRTFLLLTLALWGFCRFYFFALQTASRKDGHFDPASAAASVARKSRSPLLNQ
jgi:hypothetical protein